MLKFDFSSSTIAEHTIALNPEQCKGVKSIYIVFTAATNVYFDAWQFSESVSDAVSDVPGVQPASPSRSYDLSGRPVSPSSSRSTLVIEQHADGKRVKHIRKNGRLR